MKKTFFILVVGFWGIVTITIVQCTTKPYSNMKAPIIKQNPQGADAAVVATQLGGTPGANGAACPSKTPYSQGMYLECYQGSY